MTGHEFSSYYELLQNLTTQGVRSFHARQRATGRAVMVHFLDGGPTPVNQQLLSRLETLESHERDKVLEMVEVDGSTAVVTESLPGFRTLDTWLEAAAGPTRPLRVRLKRRDVDAVRESTSATSPPPGPTRPPGEFTRQFQAPATRPNAPPPSTNGFTEIFSRDTTPPDSQVASPLDPGAESASPSAPPSTSPGEFTRIFQSYAVPRSAPDSPTPAPIPPVGPDGSPGAQAPKPPPSGSKIKVTLRPRTPPNPSSAAVPGSATQMLQPGATSPGGVAPTADSSWTPAPPAEGGSVTSIFAAGPSSVPRAPASAAQLADRGAEIPAERQGTVEGPSRSRLVLLVALLFSAAAGAVAYFTLLR